MLADHECDHQQTDMEESTAKGMSKSNHKSLCMISDGVQRASQRPMGWR